MTKRQEATQYLLTHIDMLMPGSENKKILEASLASLDDEQFASLMNDYHQGKDRPPIYVPNLAEHKLSVERNLAVGKLLGHDFFERLWIGSEDPNTPAYLTPIKYMVVELPARRQAQLLIEGISTSEHNRSVDQITGQVAGDSAAAKVSFPELQILRAMGMDDTIQELIKFRGGDLKGLDAMNTAIARDGEVSLRAIEPFASGVESGKSLKVLLMSMMLNNTL